MFKPDGRPGTNIFVPLRVITVYEVGGWTATTSNGDGSTQIANDKDDSAFPHWNTKYP